jgi:amino-acid N-acetyltransferase
MNRLGAHRAGEAPAAVEPARAEDLPALLGLLDSGGLPTLGFHDCLGSCLVVRSDGDLVGAVALELYGQAGLLRSLVVDESRRGHALGGLLTSAILQLARGRGVGAVYLLTETATAFFARFGFVTVDRAEIPATVRRSVEFTVACPATAVAMALELG